MSQLPFESQEAFADAEYAFSPPEPERRRLGRRSLIDDPSLHNRRDRLVQIFEGFWGEIGLALQRVRRPDDLVTVFKILEGNVWDDFISAFWTPSDHSGSARALAKIRFEYRQMGKPMRVASEANRTAYDRLQHARAALSQEANRRERKLIRKEFAKRWKEARLAEEESKKLNDRDNSLRAQLKLAEASFTRGEIFRFIKSKRYELNPLNLANAVAGLPFMAWRQSVLRCTKEESLAANGTQYVVFKAIRYLVLTVKKKNIQEFVNHFHAGVPQLPSRYRLARGDLAEKWLFLERALREVYRMKLHPRALPFEITKTYFRQMRVQTHADILLAQRAKLQG
ncbi:MAG: hypothetical protein LAO78_06650 [Acidobacteriia bacterium]|nr:hypothetical protein [Terriglobia bacterium]